MNRISINEARVRRLLPPVAEGAFGRRIDWMHPDPEPDADGNAHPRGGT